MAYWCRSTTQSVKFHLTNSYFGLIFPYVTFGLPFAISVTSHPMLVLFTQLTAFREVLLSTAPLRFPGAHPAVTSVIFGLRNADELRTNLEQSDTPIDPALWRALKDEQLLRADAPTP